MPGTGNKTYVSLHEHSVYSILDGAQTPEAIAKRSAELGMPAATLTDHGRMGGLVSFEKACHQYGVKPILGIEAYCCGIGRSRKERVNYTQTTKDKKGKPGYEKTNGHLILLAKDEAGYRNMCQLTTESFATGYYYKPRIDYDLLKEHHEGLIVSSACCLGELSYLVYNHDIEKAYRVARWFQNVFGDDYYVEIMNHGLPMELDVMRELRGIADDLGIKTIVTNDAHYTYKEDAKVQKTMMLLGMHKSWSDSDVSGSFFDDEFEQQGEVTDADDGEVDPIFETSSELYIKSYDEMVEACRVNGGENGRVEQELANTLEVAEKCQYEIPFIDPEDTDAYILPTYDVTSDVRYDEYRRSNYQIPLDIKEACVKEIREEGHPEVNVLSDYMSDDEQERLRFLMWLCDDGIRKRVVPKIEAGGKPLPDDMWIQNKPKGMEVIHSHDAPDEQWVQSHIADGKTEQDMLQEYHDRLTFETSVVVAKKFVNYFLIVQSYVNYVRSKGEMVGTGRGSGAGSLLNYLSGITGIDPIPNDLLFFRFLNKDRKGYPDIDVDFSSHGRDDILWPHLREQYGKPNTAMVAAYTYLWGKAAIKASARVLFDRSNDPNATAQEKADSKQVSVTLSNSLCDLIDNKPKLDLNGELTDDIDEQTGQPLGNTPLKELIRTDERYQQVIALALRLQGMIGGESQHASAYILSPHPITNRLPLMVSKEERERSQSTGQSVENYVIQYDGREIQDQLGYVKLDLLCINDLEVITKTLNTIEQVYGTRIDIDRIPLDSKITFDILQQGKTAGVFQFDGSPVPRRLITEGHASKIGDLSMINALDRPGALGVGMDKEFVERKNDPSKIEYFSPAAEKILKSTYGLACFQEALMLLSESKDIVGFTPGEADTMRKILAHKDKARIHEILEKAHERANENNVPKSTIDDFCAMAVASGSYSFNAAHSLAYATIAYRGAFLKTYFPDCFLASVSQIKPQMKGKDKIADYLDEARQLGVRVVPPHVNWSQVGFSVPQPHVIAYGLERIKSVGKAAQGIIDEREANGPFTDLTDFICRVPKTITKTAIKALVNAGALDNLGWTRKDMVENLDAIIKVRKDWLDGKVIGSNEGQMTLGLDLGISCLHIKSETVTSPRTGRESTRVTVASEVTHDPDAVFADGMSHNDHGIILMPPTGVEYAENQLIDKEYETFGMYFGRTPEDYSELGKFKATRDMIVTYNEAMKRYEEGKKKERETGIRSEIPKPKYRPINLSDITLLHDKKNVEFTAYVDGYYDRYLKCQRPYREFKSGKGASVFVADWGIGAESQYGFSPTRYATRVTVFSKVWDDKDTTKPGLHSAVLVRGRISKSEKFGTSVIADEIRLIEYDVMTLKDGNERRRLQQEVNEYKRKMSDPSSKAYQIPRLVFPDEETFKTFNKMPSRYVDAFYRVLVNYDGSGHADIIRHLRPVRGMVRIAMRMGATAEHVTDPIAKTELARRFDDE